MSEPMRDLAADWGGPYVQVATLCEKVLEEKDGVLSAIRMIDRFVATIAGPSADVTPIPAFQGVLLLMFKAGKATGSARVTVAVEAPSGLTKSTGIDTTIFFEGQDRGANIFGPIKIQPESEGLYWFIVTLDGRFMTRVPLRVTVQRQKTPLVRP